MTLYDDDSAESWSDGTPPDDSLDEYPDQRDLAREDQGVQCAHCGKWMLSDSEMCPRCHRWQTDAVHPQRKSRWYVVTVITCVVMVALFWVGLSWHREWWPW